MMVVSKLTTKIFYIDDDFDDLEFFKDAVDDLGKNVELFNMPDPMIELLRNPPPAPSVIFLDLNMPFKTGFEIIEIIRKSDAYQDLPLIIYSTASSIESITKCRELGASMYVVKPTSMENLKKAIMHVVDIDWENHNVTAKNFLYKSS